MNELKQYKNKLEFADHLHKMNNASYLGLTAENIQNLIVLFDSYEEELKNFEKQIEDCNEYALVLALIILISLIVFPELITLLLPVSICTLVVGLVLNKRFDSRPVFTSHEMKTIIEQMIQKNNRVDPNKSL
jgi:hypothetical protein